MSKTLLGVAYILQAIPYVNIVGLFLVPIGWIIEGRARKKGLWTATGVIGLLAVILIIAGFASAIGAIFSVISGVAASAGNVSAGAGGFEALAQGLGIGMVALGLIVIGGILGIVYFLLMMACLFQAGSFYKSTLIKVGAIFYLLFVILIIAGIAIIVTSAQSGITSGEGGMAIAGTAVLAFIGAAIMNFLAGILAGVGFLIAKEPVTYQQYPAYQAVPPPTAAPPA